MQIRKRSIIREFLTDPNTRDSAKPLKTWIDVVTQANWTSFVDVKASYATASYANGVYIFNIGGNKYRLICKIDFVRQEVSVDWIGTHKEYDRL
jgi:mRNA interferase HigB